MSSSRSLTEYRRCNSCGQIAALGVWHRANNGDINCASCGKSNSNNLWPEPSVRTILEMVLNAPPHEPYYERLACLLLTACLEEMMRDQLWIMGMFDGMWLDTDFLLEPLLDAYRGRQRQLQLYRRLGYGSFADECKEADLPDYTLRWQQISDQRNHFAHSTSESTVSLSADDIERFICDALVLFSRIHNKYNAQTIGYKAAISPPSTNEIKKLLQELNDEED